MYIYIYIYIYICHDDVIFSIIFCTICVLVVIYRLCYGYYEILQIVLCYILDVIYVRF